MKHSLQCATNLSSSPEALHRR